MNTETDKKQELLNLRSHLKNYLSQQPYYKTDRKGFFLCQDPNHNDTNPSMMFNKKNNTCHCFSCGATHDIFWFIQRDYNLNSFGEAVAKAKELYEGIVSNAGPSYIPKEKNYMDYFKNLTKKPFDYLQKRGINEWLIDSLAIFLDENHNSIIFPTSKSSYTERFIDVVKDDEINSRYKHFGSSHLYSPIPEDLFDSKIPPVFIVEGEIDAISIIASTGLGEGLSLNTQVKLEDIHALSIGLGSANNTFVLINNLKKMSSETINKYKFVIALDNDNAGVAGTNKLIEELSKLNANYIVVNPYGKYKDANEALINDKNRLRQNIEFITTNYNDIKTGKIQFASSFDENNYISGNFKKIHFISEQLELIFKNYIKNNNIESLTYNDEHILSFETNISPKSHFLGLLNRDVYPTLEEYAAFNNMFIQNINLESFKTKTYENVEIKDTPISNDLITAKLKYLISDAYKSFHNTDISASYIMPDDIYLHINNLKNMKLNSLMNNENKMYDNLISEIDYNYEKFESYYINYKKLTRELLSKIKLENLQVDLDKSKLREMGILNESNSIIKYPEFYKLVSEAIKTPTSQHNQAYDSKEDNHIVSNTLITKNNHSKDYEKNTPYVLRNLPIFCCWKSIWDEKRNNYIKIPINPKTGKRAMPNEEERCYPPVYDETNQIVFDTYKDSTGKERRRIRRNFEGNFDIRRLSDDSCSWTDFKTACEAVEKWGCDGIGINAVKHLNLFLIDLDDVVEENGELKDIAKEFISTIPTYAEYSPSGKGIHMIGYADIDENRTIRNGNVELYSAKHFIALTGRLVEGVPVKVCNKKSATPAINSLIRKYLSKENSTTKQYFYQQTSQYSFPMEENEMGFDNNTIIKRCMAMYEIQKQKYNGMNIFDELYNKGNWEPFFKSQSDADLFLVGRLKFFTTSKSQVDELFRESALMRDKWNQSVGSGFPYGMNTINLCFKQQQYSYTTQQNTNQSIKE